MQHTHIEEYKFADFRQYSEEQWKEFRQSLVRIVEWSFGGGSIQHADVEDITQDILLGIQRALRRPVYLGREEAPIKRYTFKAARNRVNSHFRRSSWAQKYRALADDFDIPVPLALSNDLVLVAEAFNSLKQKDRDRLEEEIFESGSTLEKAGGSKQKANLLYKRTSVARARFRAALLHVRREENALVRHLDAKFASLKEVA